MSFDADSNLPLVNPHKKTTQVNFWIGGGVLLFVVVSVSVIFWHLRRYGAEPPPTPVEQLQKP
jgi:hypothetical protein